MTNLLIRCFIKDYKNTSSYKVRAAYGLLGSIVGILVNVILCFSKISIGLIFSSVAILADGINNLSDAGSSIVTLIGFKLSSKPADSNHPYGHERIEYLSGLIVSFIILLLGLELVRSAFDKILHPQVTVYNTLMFIVLGLSILMKLWLYRFNHALGNQIQSTTLLATASDSLNDVLATSAVFIAAIIGKFTGLQLDGYMGILVGLFIIYSGIGLIRETTNPLLGSAPDPELIETIKNKLLSYPIISGFHDLILHSYGPNRRFASVHAEVPADANLLTCHDLIDMIERDFASELGINLVIHLDPIITQDEHVNKLKAEVTKIVTNIDEHLSIHDFRLVIGPTHTNIIFDILVPVSFPIIPEVLAQTIDLEVKKIDPTYYTVITVDTNYVATAISSYKREK